jgi:putative ABC transport system substrate-binding protein
MRLPRAAAWRALAFAAGVAHDGAMAPARRRRFLAAAAALLTASPSALAQRSMAAVPRIGFLGVSTPAAWAPRIEAFRAGLRELGYVEGRNIVIEYRFAEGRYDRLPELAAELVRLKVDVIFTHSAPGALAAKQATASDPIPVVMTNVGDAVGWGIVASLARPGGNITGDTFFVTELLAKRLEMLKEALPRVRRIAAFVNPDNARMGQSFQAMATAAGALSLTTVEVRARGEADLADAFAQSVREKADALAVIEDVALIPSNARIAELAIARRLPSIGSVEYAEAGGLLGYGVNFPDLYRRAAVFVDRILKGAKPADIPIERPTLFEFVLNGKAARALGVVLPAAVQSRLDREVA